jgi:formylglycine-generating enzyme required for sulfatase activity
MGNGMGTVSERPEHEVTISQPFYISTCPVTQKQFREVMDASPSYFEGEEHPVESVSWHEAMEFCRRVTEEEQVSGRLRGSSFFRLPTEAEWEFACRYGEDGQEEGEQSAGETVLLGAKGNEASLAAVAWFQANSEGTTHPVARKSPSPMGLYDMQGNVAEWCLDWYDSYPAGNQTDPMGPEEGRRKVRRGGGWFSIASRCRSTDRAGVLPQCRCALLGFRVALVAEGPRPYQTEHLVL